MPNMKKESAAPIDLNLDLDFGPVTELIQRQLTECLEQTAQDEDYGPDLHMFEPDVLRLSFEMLGRDVAFEVSLTSVVEDTISFLKGEDPEDPHPLAQLSAILRKLADKCDQAQA